MWRPESRWIRLEHTESRGNVQSISRESKVTTIMSVSYTHLVVKDSPEDEEDQADFDLLEERFLAYPDLAITQSHLAMNGMAKKARKNILRALSLFLVYSTEKFNKVQEKETLIDKYEDKLGTYLMQMSTHEMNGDVYKRQDQGR